MGLPATCVIQYVKERWGGLQFRFKRIERELNEKKNSMNGTTFFTFPMFIGVSSLLKNAKKLDEMHFFCLLCICFFCYVMCAGVRALGNNFNLSKFIL